MRAHARVDVGIDTLHLRSDPPLTLRATPHATYLVGSAAGPLGGDELALDVDLAPGATHQVRTAAATLHHPSPVPAVSTMTTTVTLGAGAHLDWLPEPAVMIAGCDHRASVDIRLDDRATLVWREEIVLGRRHEPGGSLVTSLRVDRSGVPMLRTSTRLGPRWPGADGPAGADGARVLGSLLLVGRDEDHGAALTDLGAELDADGCRWAAMPLDGPAVVVSVLGSASGPVSRLLDRVVHRWKDHLLRPDPRAVSPIPS
ncbi:MAG: urease accessory protein UreD [Acidimicrobiales bacterium]